ncbi:hypothetical protein HUJ05_006512 [Dendroctonus ponderosae]|nr:hypothetical protein HUJ05_006512 [Dendroctonus ponderosae]
MHLSGVNNHVVQGSNVMLICDVHGARPAATIRWTNGSIPITDETLVHTGIEDNSRLTTEVKYNDRDGTFNTKSQLVFQASHYENGIKIHCYAENEVTKHKGEPEGHKVLILEVRYPPVILVKPKYITVNESTAVSPNNGTLLICSYKANPQELKGAFWSKDGKNLTLTDKNKYSGGTIENPPLIIYNAKRDDMGEYNCWLKNEVGMEQSEDSILLNVQYPPDVEVLMDPSTPVKARDKTNVMLECNVTSGNPSNLSKVRWFLDGELMKEFPECNYTSKDDSGGPFCGLDPTILSLERVDETFAGNYTCQGENVAGWGPISEPIELIVYYPPSPANIRSYPTKVVKGAEVNLECKVESAGRPDNVTYIWYRGSHQMTEITTSKHKIVPVGLETNSNFTCIAVNEGGQSDPATLFINVNAPPALFDRLKPYQGILYSAQQINLTCRVECSPLCSIIWKRNGRIIDFNNKPLYYNQTIKHDPDLQKNIFESIESTLIWNMTAWPGNKLNRTAPNSNYTCQSESNQIGPGVSSTIEIAVDYPPEDVYVSTKIVKVIEGQAPNPVKCHGKGHPNLTYKWKKNSTAEPREYGEELRLGPMIRSDSGTYICEASNKHGTENAVVYFNVMYAPECSITRTERDGSPALLCTVQANPQEVSFFWKAREGNETYSIVNNNNIVQDGLKSFLILDSTVDTKRTYQCFANNSVGLSDKQPCEMDVAGILPWWKRLTKENLYIIIASIIAIIICVIIICIVIIVLCRRKRANTKYNNPLEMEEREKQDDDAAIDQSKWPLQPGVLVHVSKMNNVSQLNVSTSPFRTTSIKTSTCLKFRRNKSKVYARLKWFRDALGRGSCERPFGIKERDCGVVTFKKIKTSPTDSKMDIINPRKRKKPGDAPINPSSTVGDKIRPGVAPPVGSMQDHPLSNNTDPNDKGFYENLPFHGMQNPPNKPVSVIAPFHQGVTRNLTSSRATLNSNAFNHTFQPTHFRTLQPKTNTLKRNQSFAGFQSNPNGRMRKIGEPQQLPWATQYSIFMRNINPTFLGSTPNVPVNFEQSNFYTPLFPALMVPNNNFSSLPIHQAFSVNPSYQNNQYYQPLGTKVSTQKRIVGRNEANFNQKRATNDEIGTGKESVKAPAQNKPKKTVLTANRFNSLKTEKHKCYSPTFYSMRCRKHAKKRPIVYALPKKCLNHLPKDTKSTDTHTKDFQNLTDSIQIFEQNDDEKANIPTPAPRCKKHKTPEIIYANICESLQRSIGESPNSSSDSCDGTAVETSTTEVEVHSAGDAKQPDDERDVRKENGSFSEEKRPKIVDHSPRLVAFCPKKLQPLDAVPKISPQAMKNSPILKVSPNFIKPNVESPKGALSLKIQARKNWSPIQSPSENKKQPTISLKENTQIQSAEEESCKAPNNIPQMPILIPKSPSLDKSAAPNNNNAAANQNAFYTLTAPHCKQPILPPQYSATIPHQKHTKLIPKALFQEQIAKSKSFSSKSSKHKKHFQIPLQKCHSFKFQTAESYFQPIKNIHEENLMRNGYAGDYPASSSSTSSLQHKNTTNQHKREKPKQKSKGPLVLRHPSDYQEQFQENIQNSVHLQYPQPIIPGRGSNIPQGKQNGVVQYADLDMPVSRKSSHESSSSSSSKSHSKKQKPKTEYATLRFNEVGQEIDV